MVAFPVTLGEFCAELGADVGKKSAQCLYVSGGKDVTAVLGRKDTMRMGQKDTVPATATRRVGLPYTNPCRRVELALVQWKEE